MNRLSKIIISDAEKSIQGINFSQLKDKTILVTGASGLVGTYFLAGLKNIIENRKIKVKVYAVCQSNPETYWKEIARNENFKIIQGDLTSDSFVQKLPKIDYIIHAAGYGQPRRFLTNPMKTIKLNTTVTMKLLEKLKPKGHFLFMSSSEVYSGLEKPPYRENEIGTTNTDHPRACYIEAKRCGEAIICSARGEGIDAKSVRLSLAYGPGTKKDDARVINSFIYRALTEHRITLLDSGEAHRTYCYITDAVNIMWNIILHGKDALYNVGGVSGITIADLARKIGKIIGVSVQTPSDKEQTIIGAPTNVVLDLGKINKEFNKKDFISLDEGLARTISWQKQHHNL